MHNPRDLSPEHGFDQLRVLRELDRLDGAQRTSFERLSVVNEAVASCVALIDRFAPAEQSVAIRQPEPAPSNVVDMQEYRQLRTQRQEARHIIDRLPGESPVSSQTQPQPDGDAEHLANVYEMINRERAA